jgi:hypothetical protein
MCNKHYNHQQCKFELLSGYIRGTREKLYITTSQTVDYTF